MTTSIKRTKTAVRHYHDGGFLVRGTLDPMEALKIAISIDSEHRIGDYWGDVIYAERHGEPFPRRPDGEPAEWVRLFGDHLHSLLANARPGLYRVVPAPQDDDLSWYVWPAKQRGPGVFEAVEFPA